MPAAKKPAKAKALYTGQHVTLNSGKVGTVAEILEGSEPPRFFFNDDKDGESQNSILVSSIKEYGK